MLGTRSRDVACRHSIRLQRQLGTRIGRVPRATHADETSVIPATPPYAGYQEKCSSISHRKWARVVGGSKSSSGAPGGADALPRHAPRSIDRVPPMKPHGSVELAQTLAAPSRHATSI